MAGLRHEGSCGRAPATACEGICFGLNRRASGRRVRPCDRRPVPPAPRPPHSAAAARKAC